MVAVSAAALAVADRARPRWYRHGMNRGWLYRVLSLVARALSRGLRLRLAAAVAPRLRAAFGAEWDVVRRNIARIVPGAGGAARERLAADVFRHFAMCFSDLIATNRHTRDLQTLLARVEGAEHLTAALAAGRGIVLLTAHLGNWELAGRLAAGTAARPTHVVVEAERDLGVERFLRGGPAPVRFVARTRPTSALPLLAALRRGDIVAMQGDRALGNRGDVTVSFFGAPAAFPQGPFVLARAAGALLVPAFCVLGQDRRYVVEVAEPIAVEAGGERTALERWVAVLERAVGAHPEQWFNFYDCWSASPAR